MSGANEHGLELPARTSASLEEDLIAESQEIAMSQMGKFKVLSSWWEELTNRPFDIPEYVALNGRATIVVYLSTNAVGRVALLKQIFAERRPWQWYASAFLKGSFPVLRCSLVVPDNPADPYVLESPLNICNGDVQEFCKAVVECQALDLVVGHEGLPVGEYAAASFDAPGIRRLARSEFNSASRALRPMASADEFSESVQLLEQLYPSALSGLDLRQAIRLEYAGKARNTYLEFER